MPDLYLNRSCSTQQSLNIYMLRYHGTYNMIYTYFRALIFEGLALIFGARFLRNGIARRLELNFHKNCINSNWNKKRRENEKK